jgi:hypothetical protein
MSTTLSGGGFTYKEVLGLAILIIYTGESKKPVALATGFS